MIGGCMTNLFVPDVAAAVALWRDVLGADLLLTVGDPAAHIVMAVGHSHLALTRLDAADPTARDLGDRELICWTEDVDTAYAAAVDAGATSLAAPADHPSGHRRAMIADGTSAPVALVDVAPPGR